MTDNGTTTEDRSAAVRAVVSSGKYDPAARRRSKRAGRERGCWIYIPADELQAAGIDPHDTPPFYRCWGTKRRGLMVRFYKEA